jgi:TatD DNase family protein
MFIDTHCHIYLEEFDADRDEMLQRAGKEGVEKYLMPAIDSGTHHVLFEVEQKYKGKAMAMMGLHPCSVNENWESELALVKQFLDTREFVAIGEIGLDYYWDKSFIKQQQAALHTQLDWAATFDRPFVIHSRDAVDDCIEIAAKHQDGTLKGVFHCFSGSLEQAGSIIDHGFYLGIGGVLTFKNGGLDKVIRDIDLKHLVLETDAPYLAPVPFRGKRNECSYLKNIALKLADIKGVDVAEIRAVTTANAKKLFSL